MAWSGKNLVWGSWDDAAVTEKSADVLIAGAGPVGLATAFALGHCNIPRLIG